VPESPQNLIVEPTPSDPFRFVLFGFVILGSGLGMVDAATAVWFRDWSEPSLFFVASPALLAGISLWGALGPFSRAPTRLSLSENGLEFDYEDGTRRSFNWTAPGSRLLVEDVEAIWLGGGETPAHRFFVTPPRGRYVRVTHAGFDEILNQARAHGLDLARSRRTSPAGTTTMKYRIRSLRAKVE
jgi:hypothetical protein